MEYIHSWEAHITISRVMLTNHGLLTSMRTKSKPFHKKLQTPSMANINRCKKYTNMYNKIKKSMKKNYYHKLIDDNKHNIKETWNILKSVLTKKNDKSSFPQQFNINNINISDKSTIANSFKDFFSNIGKITSNNIAKANTKFSDYLNNPIPNSIFLEPVEASQINEIVNKMKPKCSTGHDDISMKLIKHSLNNISTPLTHILNKSLMTGVVPKDLKIAKVIPIFKNGDNSIMQNYRPISLLPAF